MLGILAGTHVHAVCEQTPKKPMANSQCLFLFLFFSRRVFQAPADSHILIQNITSDHMIATGD